MKTPLCVLLALSMARLASLAAEEKPSPLGYSDTPLIPGTKWKVHDIDRPAPPAVRPGARVGDAPADAIIIFDGRSTAALQSRQKDTNKIIPCPWKIDNGELVVDGGDCWTKQEFASCQLHLEWKSAPNTKGNSQKKGNGGVFFMDRYESQMLDCDNNPTYADGMAGAVYGQTPPMVNAVKKAGEWQVYDIVFTAPKVVDGKVVEPAYVTTFLNGICVQNHTRIMGPTLHKLATGYTGSTEGWLRNVIDPKMPGGVFPAKAPLRLQDHKNEPPVRVRNIWVRPLP